jgi:dTDP-glucose 4,6-dehydratase
LTGRKLEREAEWSPEMTFEKGLADTIAWYQENQEWVRHVKTGEYREYYSRNYEKR